MVPCLKVSVDLAEDWDSISSLYVVAHNHPSTTQFHMIQNPALTSSGPRHMVHTHQCAGETLRHT